jgi:hypothetical protein
MGDDIKSAEFQTALMKSGHQLVSLTFALDPLPAAPTAEAGQ